ncbi:MAG TPA: hypothetical protein VF873_10280 [Gemmatimonadales bacterium]
MAAPALEKLHQTGEIDAWRRPHDHVDVCPENFDVHDLHVLAGSGLLEIVVQERFCRLVYHRPALERGPYKVNEDLVR